MTLRTTTRIWALGAALAIGSIAMPTLAATVTGPVPTTGIPGDTGKNTIFFATTHDLEQQRYVEQEYFMDGVANRYAIPAGQTATITDGNHAYRTRLVVRRPQNARDFNGKVVVEWFNVTNNFDAENTWFMAYEHLLKQGYAFVGVSAQRVGVDALKAWSPGRYGSLDVEQGGTITDDSLSYDIFTQAGQVIRNPGSVNILGGLRPTQIIAIGESQSAGRLATYVNSIMPLGNVWDGVLLVSPLGAAIRADVAAPVFKVVFEWELSNFEAVVRQPASARFNSWEVAGTAHVDYHLRLSREPLELRDNNGVSSEAVLAPQCGNPNIGSHAPNHYVVAAAFEQLSSWIATGVHPTAAPPIEIASFGPGTTATIARDSFNIAKGGIRLSQVAVPLAANVGQNTGASACARWGYYAPFSIQTLDSLYATQSDYYNAVVNVTRSNLQSGFITNDDARTTLNDALNVRIGSAGLVPVALPTRSR